MLIRNQNGNQNYLNTIESEGNLQTQQFGKENNNNNKLTKDCNNLSQRSIHSLDEAEGEDQIMKSANENDSFHQYPSVSNQNQTSMSKKSKEMTTYQKKQIFSYEK